MPKIVWINWRCGLRYTLPNQLEPICNRTRQSASSDTPVYKVVTGLLVELRAREQQAAQELSFSGSDGWSYLFAQPILT